MKARKLTADEMSIVRVALGRYQEEVAGLGIPERYSETAGRLWSACHSGSLHYVPDHEEEW